MTLRLRLTIATPALVLGIAAVALAATPKTGTYKAAKGQVQRGYDLSFKVDQGGKRISHVVAHVLETCSGESTSSTTTVGPGLTWAVKGGRFSGRKKEKSGASRCTRRSRVGSRARRP
jgi:hypothetical protein